MVEVITLGETMVMFSPEQNGPLRYVQRFQKRIAGSESNVAIGLVRLGHPSGWISRVGNDEFGQFLLREIKGEGVDVSGTKIDSSAPTGLMFKEIQEGRETRVVYYRKDSAASYLAPEDLPEEYFRHAGLLHLTGITPALSESCFETIQAAIRLARKNGLMISFDPNLRLKLWTEAQAKKILSGIWKQADIVLSGLDEAQLLLGSEEPEVLMDKFLEQGAKIVALKAGPMETWVASPDKRYKVPAFQIKSVIDPIGAGDAFAAGFLAGLLEKRSLDECAKLANAMGAMAVMSSGDFEGLPTRNELEAFMTNRSQVYR